MLSTCQDLCNQCLNLAICCSSQKHSRKCTSPCCRIATSLLGGVNRTSLNDSHHFLCVFCPLSHKGLRMFLVSFYVASSLLQARYFTMVGSA